MTDRFKSFPYTPDSEPTQDYQVANKKYVDSLSSKFSSSVEDVYSSIGFVGGAAGEPIRVYQGATSITTNISTSLKLEFDPIYFALTVSNTASIAIDFVPSGVSHTSISDRGTITHASIDSLFTDLTTSVSGATSTASEYATSAHTDLTTSISGAVSSAIEYDVSIHTDLTTSVSGALSTASEFDISIHTDLTTSVSGAVSTAAEFGVSVHTDMTTSVSGAVSSAIEYDLSIFSSVTNDISTSTSGIWVTIGNISNTIGTFSNMFVSASSPLSVFSSATSASSTKAEGFATSVFSSATSAVSTNISTSTSTVYSCLSTHASATYPHIGSNPKVGFDSKTSSSMSMNSSSFIIAPTGTLFRVWAAGSKYDQSVTLSVPIANDNTLHFVYFTTAGEMSVGTAAWDITGDAAPCAMVYRTGTKYAIFDERHSSTRNRAWHEWAHDTIGCRYESGLEGTIGNSSFSFATGQLHDEDLEVSVDTQTVGKIWYLNAGGATNTFTTTSVPYYISGDGTPQFDNAGTITSVTNNQYFNSWFYGTNDKDHPIFIVAGQKSYGTVTSARNEGLPTIQVSQREWKSLYRATYRNVGGSGTYIEATDYRVVSSGPGSTYTPNSHLTLTDIGTMTHPSIDLALTATGSIWTTVVDLTTSVHDHSTSLNTLSVSTNAIAASVDTQAGKVNNICTTVGNMSTWLRDSLSIDVSTTGNTLIGWNTNSVGIRDYRLGSGLYFSTADKSVRVSVASGAGNPVFVNLEGTPKASNTATSVDICFPSELFSISIDANNTASLMIKTPATFASISADCLGVSSITVSDIIRASVVDAFDISTSTMWVSGSASIGNMLTVTSLTATWAQLATVSVSGLIRAVSFYGTQGYFDGINTTISTNILLAADLNILVNASSNIGIGTTSTTFPKAVSFGSTFVGPSSSIALMKAASASISHDLRASVGYFTSSSIDYLNSSIFYASSSARITRLGVGPSCSTVLPNILELVETFSVTASASMGLFVLPKFIPSAACVADYAGIGGFCVVSNMNYNAGSKVQGLKFWPYCGFCSGGQSTSMSAIGVFTYGAQCVMGVFHAADVIGLFCGGFDSYMGSGDLQNVYGIVVDVPHVMNTRALTDVGILIKHTTEISASNRYQLKLDGFSTGAGIFFNVSGSTSLARIYQSSPNNLNIAMGNSLSNVIGMSQSAIGFYGKTPKTQPYLKLSNWTSVSVLDAQAYGSQTLGNFLATMIDMLHSVGIFRSA